MLKPYIDNYFDVWTKEIINDFFKSILWLGFIFVVLRKYNVQIPIKQMFKNPIKKKIIIPASAVIIAYILVIMFIQHRGFHINTNFHPSRLIGQFLLVGILEELVFRGWFLNSLSLLINERKANLISALFFVFIHYPSYIVGAHPSLILTNSLGIFFAGLIFGWSFYKSKSLWVPIILHMLWDLLAILLL